ncbi:uncharacterized protein J3D65DRAFT_412479 [Phyllosticta citribraziliensis]|uniref:F-box domain-containing protein n=1 Tax=Phyllosticta citribraziliensis TaxID=989973 RepID=A0ABR1LM82_9PEZI
MASEDVTLNGLSARTSELSVAKRACEEHGITSLGLDATRQVTAPRKSGEQDMKLGKNDTASPPGLDTMPAEILLGIDDCLDKTSALSLRLASRRMQEVFKYTENRNSFLFTTRSSRALRRLLVKDAVKAEKSGRVLVEDALQAAKEGQVHPGFMQPCAHCKAFHTIDCFSAEQLQEQPAHRKCLGYERVLYFCDHWILNYFQLAKLPDGEPLQWTWSEYPRFLPGTSFRCGCFHSLSKSEQELRPPTSTHQPQVHRLENKSIRVTMKADCFPVNARGELDAKEGVFRCFEEDKWAVCQHMHAATLHDFVPEDTFSQPMEDGKLATIKGIIDGKCRAPHCRAKFSLHWEIGGEFPDAFYEAHLEYSREIEISGMNGPEWLANTEVVNWEFYDPST